MVIRLPGMVVPEGLKFYNGCLLIYLFLADHTNVLRICHFVVSVCHLSVTCVL